MGAEQAERERKIQRPQIIVVKRMGSGSLGSKLEVRLDFLTVSAGTRHLRNEVSVCSFTN